MILPIYTHGQAVLKKETDEIDENYEGLEQLIKDMLPLLSKDSSIAFESANQYFYLPIDLVEAYISVDYALQWLDTLEK